MVLSVLNPKGGSGKTTLATNLSRGLQAHDEVLLLDLDPQQSAQEWAERNPDDYPGVLGVPQGRLPHILELVKNRMKFIVIDGAAIMGQQFLSDAIRSSDLILIPVQPSGLDLWGVSDLVDLIQSRQNITGGTPKAAFVVSRQVRGTRFAASVNDRLTQMNLPVLAARITQRIAFAEAASVGLSVLDYAPESLAAQEIQQLTQETLQFYAQN